MSRQNTKEGYYTTWQLAERGWSRRLVTVHLGGFADYYSATQVERVEATPEWYRASAEDSARRDANAVMRSDHSDRVEAGELLTRTQLHARGWSDRLITSHLRVRGLRTPEYVAQLERRLGVATYM